MILWNVFTKKTFEALDATRGFKGGGVATGVRTYFRVHVDEAVSSSGGEGGSADHSAVMKMVMMLQTSDLQSNNHTSMKNSMEKNSNTSVEGMKLSGGYLTEINRYNSTDFTTERLQF